MENLQKIVSSDTVKTSVGKGRFDRTEEFGIFSLTHRNAFGDILGARIVHNLITSAGKAAIASRINGSGSEAVFTYLAVGVGATAASVSDTTLQTEITDSGLARVNATASRVTTSVTNDTARLVTTFTVTGTKAVTEAGILNAASAGTLLSRQVFTAVNVANGDSLQLTYSVQAS